MGKKQSSSAFLRFYNWRESLGFCKVLHQKQSSLRICCFEEEAPLLKFWWNWSREEEEEEGKRGEEAAEDFSQILEYFWPPYLKKHFKLPLKKKTTSSFTSRFVASSPPPKISLPTLMLACNRDWFYTNVKLFKKENVEGTKPPKNLVDWWVLYLVAGLYRGILERKLHISSSTMIRNGAKMGEEEEENGPDLLACLLACFWSYV